MGSRTTTLVKALLGVLFLSSSILALYLLNLPAFFKPEQVKNVLETVGPLAPLLYMLVMAATAIIVPIPGPPLYVIAGVLFGPVLGTVYAVAGSVAGAAVAFLLARFLGRDYVESMLGRHVVICCECSEGLLTRIVFFARLIPLVSFDVVSYGAGLTRMRLRNFILATLLGFIPMTFLYHTFGSVLTVSAPTAVTLGLLIVAALFVLPYIVRRSDLEKFRPRMVTPERHPETGELIDPCAGERKE
jgi:uncharacterized membrane protein YdjX (TVP38/TMEM64 family)